MSLPFIIIAFVTLLAASAAMSLRNLVHCALALAVTFAGLAALYLNLDAQFVGFAQILVYVGAVAILIVFAILLTRSGDSPNQAILAPGWLYGIIISSAVFTVIGRAILTSPALSASCASCTSEGSAVPVATVKDIGKALMEQYVLPLEVIGLLLTAAMIGAVIIALRKVAPKTMIEDSGLKRTNTSVPSTILHPPSASATTGGQS
jgi:NADH-quinone oxidoreductase subunit J